MDGVLTDGRITYTNNGDELKSFNVKDGLGLSIALKFGFKFGVITKRESKIVQHRMQELGAEFIYQKVDDKFEKLKHICHTYNLEYDEIMYIGDDLIDLKVMKQIGFSATPADGHFILKDEVDYVCEKKGGKGAVREVMDLLVFTNFSIDEVKKYYV